MIKKLKLFIGCNVVFLLYYLHDILLIPKSVLSILINLIIFIIPGYCCACIFKKKINNLISFIFLTICLSTAILILGVVFFYLSGISPSPAKMLILLIIITNSGILFFKSSDNSYTDLKYFILVFSASIILYLALYIGATRLIPPLEDHDMETQGTVFGIMNHLKPHMVTNRGTVYFFAHPLLLHFYIGNTSLFLGELDEFSFYYKSAVSAEKELNEKNSKELLFKNWRNDLRSFFANPHLLATRMPNIFLSAISLMVLFYLIYTVTNSFLFSFLGPLIYFSFPEVFVRSSYGGYMAITNFSLLIMAYFYINKEKIKIETRLKDALLFISGLFGALTDQKIAIFIIAVSIREFFGKNGNLFDKIKSSLSEKIVQGSIFGTICFWVYGFIVNQRAFLEDHLSHHVANRFSLDDIRFSHSKTIWYPSIIELWKEFNSHLGIPFLVIATLLTLYTIKNIKEKKSVLCLWFLTGAFLFSITDWRQTKHLMHIIPSLVISTLIFVSERKMWLKVIFIILFAFIIYNNIEVIVKLSKDFTTISPTPIW